MINIIKNIEFGKLLENFSRLKNNVSEWVVSLDSKQYNLEQELREMCFRVAELEDELKQMRLQNGR